MLADRGATVFVAPAAGDLPGRTFLLGLSGGLPLLLFLWAGLADFTIAWAKLSAVAAVLGILALVGAAYQRTGRDRRIAHTALSMSVVVWIGTINALLAQLAVGAGWPEVDPALMAFNERIGFDTEAFIFGLLAFPGFVDLLALVYEQSVPLIFLTTLILAATERYERLWRFVGLYAISLTACVLISTLTPAIGLFSAYPLDPAVISRLPPGAGDYAAGAYAALRTGADTTLDPFELTGVVTFPSFHTCMGLLIGFGLGAIPGLRLLAMLIAALTVVSTIPIGGHYLVDVIVSVVAFAILMARPFRPGVTVAGSRASGRRAPSRSRS